MKYRLLICLMALFFTLPIAADQNDQRLNGLFTELLNAENPNAAFQIEQQIWHAWFDAPEQAMEMLDRARKTAEKGALNEALEQFDALLEAYPNYAEAWNQRAIMHYLLGDIPRSLQDIQQVLTLEPRHFGALSGRGQCMLQMQQFDDALGAFEAALTIHPWLPAARQQIEMLQTILNQRNKPI